MNWYQTKKVYIKKKKQVEESSGVIASSAPGKWLSKERQNKKREPLNINAAASDV